MTADRTHYHGDGCTPPHPTATLADALNDLDHDDYAAEVLRLLRTGECDELNAAVTDAAKRMGWVDADYLLRVADETRRLHHRAGADQEGRNDG